MTPETTLAQCRVAERDAETGAPSPDCTVHMDVLQEASGLRVVFDPFGQDHDVLVEALSNQEMLVLVHAEGMDLVACVRVTPHEVVVEDACGNEVYKAIWKEKP